MSTCRMLAGLVGGAVGGGILVGGVSAGLGAASGAIGAAVLDRCYGGYSVLQATQMVASGAALLGGSVGVITGGIAGAVSAGVPNVEVKANTGTTSFGLAGFVAGETISGLIGFGLFLSTQSSNLLLNVGQVAASAATGSAILGGGLYAVTLLGICCCAAAAMSDNENDLEAQAPQASALRPA